MSYYNLEFIILCVCVCVCIQVSERCTAKPAEGESTPQCSEKCFMYVGLLKHPFCVMAS